VGLTEETVGAVVSVVELSVVELSVVELSVVVVSSSSEVSVEEVLLESLLVSLAQLLSKIVNDTCRIIKISKYFI
jgi:hypothetical protein